MDNYLIERLAKLRGIGDAYHDYKGELRYFGIETKAAILRAMGCPVDDANALSQDIRALEIARWRCLAPAIAAAAGSRIGVDLNIPARDFGATLVWSVNLELGERRSGVTSTAGLAEVWRGEVEGAWITRRRFEVPIDLPPGYHELEIKIGGQLQSRSALVLSPPQCFEPAAIESGRRLWGVAVQLYTVKSGENWGIGDFADLKALIRWLAPRGAGFIGLNPLHALAPADPKRASPYSASDRHFINILYIALPQIPEFGESPEVSVRVSSAEFADRLTELRSSEYVDYAGVAQVKLEILGILYRHFRDQHLARGTNRAESFRGFVAAGGALLQTYARFDALDRHFRDTLRAESGWLNWPPEFRDPNGPAVQAFASEHASEVEFFVYAQWLAHEQLVAAQDLARELGMPVGLYGDYAVGAHPSGSETWSAQGRYRMGAEIGAPPDPLALKGQGWGIPPPDPLAMEREQLSGFVRLIRANMRYFGALRLDHVMSLFRLWWVAGGLPPTEGAYVHYPLQQLLTVLSLESTRNACVLVGEDLGVVPDEMRRAMPEFGVYHYKVLLFEKAGGEFRAPDQYVRRALATVATHDLPTLRSFWEGRDIVLRRDLKLYPTEQIERQIIEERARDRVALLAALEREGLKPVVPASPCEPFTSDLVQALHLYLSRSHTVLVALQIEDLLGMVDPVNVPGTHQEYPNWQRKLTSDLEAIVARTDFDACLAAIDRERNSSPRSG